MAVLFKIPFKDLLINSHIGIPRRERQEKIIKDKDSVLRFLFTDCCYKLPILS